MEYLVYHFGSIYFLFIPNNSTHAILRMLSIDAIYSPLVWWSTEKGASSAFRDESTAREKIESPSIALATANTSSFREKLRSGSKFPSTATATTSTRSLHPFADERIWERSRGVPLSVCRRRRRRRRGCGGVGWWVVGREVDARVYFLVWLPVSTG